MQMFYVYLLISLDDYKHTYVSKIHLGNPKSMSQLVGNIIKLIISWVRSDLDDAMGKVTCKHPHNWVKHWSKV